MPWEAIKVFFEKHRKFFMGMVFSLIVASWLLSQVVQELVFFETSVSLTTTAVLLFVFQNVLTTSRSAVSSLA